MKRPNIVLVRDKLEEENPQPLLFPSELAKIVDQLLSSSSFGSKARAEADNIIPEE